MSGQGKQAKILSDAQVRAALGHVDSSSRYPERDRVIILLSVKAGLRAKEIAGLTWSMVTDAEGTLGDAIHLPNSASKGRNGGRTIPLNPALALVVCSGGTSPPPTDANASGGSDQRPVRRAKKLVRPPSVPMCRKGGSTSHASTPRAHRRPPTATRRPAEQPGSGSMASPGLGLARLHRVRHRGLDRRGLRSPRADQRALESDHWGSAATENNVRSTHATK